MARNEWPVLKRVRDVIEADQQTKACPPGLWLDKYAMPGDMKNQKCELDRVVTLTRNVEIPDRDALLTALGAKFLTAETSGSLTFHLARAAALENAGLALHRPHGFAYLPAAGIKGLTHAWAMEGWLPAHEKKASAWEQICRVFGWAPSGWLDKLCGRHGLDKPDGSSSGSVCFLDAWPQGPNPPELRVDIANNHHRDYYDKKGAPGDWESPEPVYFLTIAPGAEFVFPIAPRRTHSEQDKADVQFALDQLGSALAYVGAGAKTSAGYGRFDVSGPTPPSLADALVSREDAPRKGGRVHGDVFTLKILTPAFLGGANKNASPVLRIASLRGVLRSWWRAFNGHLSLGDLRTNESAIFGSTDTGQGVTVARDSEQLLCVKCGKDLEFRSGSGAAYMGYGPIQYQRDEGKCHGEIDWLEENQSFSIRIGDADADRAREVKRALWLLCALGGIGSRSRRGWGSLSLVTPLENDNLPDLSKAASVEDYGDALHKGLLALCPGERRKAPEALEWTAIGSATTFVLSTKTFPTWREAMHDIGSKFIDFRSLFGKKFHGGIPGPDYVMTKKALEQAEKQVATKSPQRLAFGLPHNQSFPSLHGRTASYYPTDGRGKEARRASPLFVKIAELRNAQFIWQVAFLPSRFLPDDFNLGVYEVKKGLDAIPLHKSPLPKPDASGRINGGNSVLEAFLQFLSDGTPPSLPSGDSPSRGQELPIASGGPSDTEKSRMVKMDLSDIKKQMMDKDKKP